MKHAFQPTINTAYGFITQRIAALASRIATFLFAALAASGRIAAPTVPKEYQ